MTIPHSVSPEQIMALADDELDSSEARRVREHIESCEHCQSVARGFRDVSSALSTWAPHPPPGGAALNPGSGPSQVAPRPGMRPWYLVAAGGVAAVMATAVYVQWPATSPDVFAVTGPATPAEARFNERAWNEITRRNLDLPPSDAKVTVVVFVDWLCPACRTAWAVTPELRELQQRNPGAIRLIVKDVPMNRACNPHLPLTLSGHEGSCEAAVAVRLAREQGRADEMIDWLFANQDLLRNAGSQGQAAAMIRDHTRALLDGNDFDRYYTAALQALRDDADMVRAADVAGTPVWIVNGRQVPLVYLIPAVEYELTHPPAGSGLEPPGGR